MREKKPGLLSSELTEALGMQLNSPPPWLINMQRYGPPPSYPNLRIPGLNAPLPPGAEYGFQPGGWGKPPVDEYGRPLYGDVFGLYASKDDYAEVPVDKETLWGEAVLAEESEAESETEEAEEAADFEDKASYYAGTETPGGTDGLSSIITSGLETPDTIDLRKRGTETPASEIYYPPRELYQVIEQAQTHDDGTGFFGSDRHYVVPDLSASAAQDADARAADRASKDDKSGGVEDADDGRGKRKRKEDDSATSKRYRDFKF